MPEHELEVIAVEVVEIVDIEECARAGHRPPHAKAYRIRIDKRTYVVHTQHMTGRQLLELAGKTPPERYKLMQKFHGGRAVEVGLDEEVDFRAHGVEKFMTIPSEQTDG
jgi:hypothetical protein